jgi:hypothetical protein
VYNERDCPAPSVIKLLKISRSIIRQSKNIEIICDPVTEILGYASTRLAFPKGMLNGALF